MSTIIGDSVDNQLYVHGVIEEGTTRVIESLSAATPYFLDIGCNIGYFTCLVGTKARVRRILSIDPNPAMIERTANNLRLNRIENGGLLNCGIGAGDGELDLHVPDNRHSLSSFAFAPIRGSGGPVKSVRARVRTLDGVILENSFEPCLAKIDTEGFEYEVLSGLSEKVARKIWFIVLEISVRNLRRAGRSPADIFSLPVMEAFDFYAIGDQNGGLLQKIDPESFFREGEADRNLLLVNKRGAPKEILERRCGVFPDRRGSEIPGQRDRSMIRERFFCWRKS